MSEMRLKPRSVFGLDVVDTHRDPRTDPIEGDILYSPRTETWVVVVGLIEQRSTIAYRVIGEKVGDIEFETYSAWQFMFANLEPGMVVDFKSFGRAEVSIGHIENKKVMRCHPNVHLGTRIGWAEVAVVDETGCCVKAGNGEVKMEFVVGQVHVSPDYVVQWDAWSKRQPRWSARF